MWEDHDDHPKDHRIGDACFQKEFKSGTYTVLVACTVIIADDRLCTLSKSLKRKHSELHNAGKDGHGSYSNISSVFQERRVIADRDDALTELHNEKGRAKSHTGQKNICFQLHGFSSKTEKCLFSKEKRQHPDTGKCLGDHGCKSSTTYTHMEAEDEYGIQNDVSDCTNENREHSCFCEALSSDEVVHAKCKLYKNSSDRVNVHVTNSEINSVGTCTEGHEKAAVSHKQDHGQYYGDDDLHGETVSQGTFSFIGIIFPHKYAGSGSTTVSDKSSEGRHYHDQRHADTDTSECQCAITGNVSYVDAVNNVIKHVDQLCSYGRKCKAQKQVANGLST